MMDLNHFSPASQERGKDPARSAEVAATASDFVDRPERVGEDGNGRAPTRKRKREIAPDAKLVTTRAYTFADLSGYRRRDRAVIRIADILFYCLIRVIGSTIRWQVRGIEHLDEIYESGHRSIFTFWHACIFPATWFWRQRGIVVMSSRSKDGEYIARFIQRFGYGTARGSSSRGAGRALAEMSECLDCNVDVAFTIDGPRGPAYVAKPGAVTLARHSGQAILPFHITSKRYLPLSSWDRLQIPLPFTRAIALIAPAIYVPRNASEDEVRRKQVLLQDTLDRLKSEGVAWRDT